MISFLKTTTSLSLAVMLSLPSIGFAQAACGNGEFPCSLPNGQIAETRLGLLEFRVDTQRAQLAEVQRSLQDAEGDATLDVTALTARRLDLEANLARTEEALEIARQEAEAGANTAAEQAAAAQAQAEEQAAAAAEQERQAQAEEQAAAAAEQERAAQAQAEEQAAAAAEQERAAQAQAEEQRLAEQQAAEEQQQADDARRAEQEAAEATKQARRAEKDAAAAAEQERRAAREAEKQQQAEEDRAARKAERQAERRAQRQAERAAQRAQSLAASEDTGTAAQVETETLTEQDTRASNEEFETAVTGDETQAKRKKDDGLSKFEKALLLGLGAVAVGKVLDNGDEVKSRSGDRVVVEREGELRVLKNDDALLRRPGNDVRTETFDDGSTRTVVTKPDDTRIVTIRGADGTVLRRIRVLPDGQEFTLFDDTQEERDVAVTTLPLIEDSSRMAGVSGEEELRAALMAQSAARNGDAYSLRQIRDIQQVRALAPQIELDAVRFASGSAAIEPEQARSLARIGNTLRDLIASDPRTVLLVEGHTDAVGDATYNLALSDRRAETVALALTEYFDVPEENLIVQGYGESQLKVPTLEAEQANRRATVRNITSLLR